MKNFFSFRSMLTSAIIKLVYALGVFALVFGGLFIALNGGVKILYGLAIIIFGNLFWRVFCEVWILLFSIHEILASIEKKLKS